MDAPPRWAPRTERIEFGKRLRDRVRRSDHARWDVPDRDPIARLRTADAGRSPELLKIKYGKMARSAFGFLRGAVPVMAPDLAAQPSTGYLVQICGDAHVRNLGAYAASDGSIVFDINDFDEACIGPWEWDLKRLAISIVLVGQQSGCDNAGEAAIAMVGAWREAIEELAELPAVSVARARVATTDGPVDRALAKAKRVTPLAARDELTRPDKDGRPRFVDHRIDDTIAKHVLESLVPYRATLGPGRRQVLDAYRPYDVAQKLSGTGNLGVGNYAVLCEGNGPDDPLILQVKQARTSSYRTLGLVGAGEVEHEGQRIVESALRMQTDVDPFLGWTTIHGIPFYVRQIADHQAHLDETDQTRSSLLALARVCGRAFAKAHARSGDAAVLTAYAGTGDNLDLAIGELAVAAASHAVRDYDRFTAAIRSGEIEIIETD